MTTIGINFLGSPGHDSAAALAIDGRVEYAIAEERLTRIKQDAGFPVEAIKACLAYKGIRMSDVDEVIFGWPELKEHFATNFRLTLKGHLKENIPAQALNYYRSTTTRNAINLLEAKGFTAKKIIHIDHHLAHALSVLPYLESEAALIFIVDGRGIRESTSVYLKKGLKLEMIKRINFPNSLGLYYAEMTSLCGFKKYADEWKVMGLAPYGQKTFDLSQLIKSSPGGYQVDHKKLLNLQQLTLNGVVIKKPSSDHEAIDNNTIRDLAHSAQFHYEQTILSFVRHYAKLYGIKSIGMAGGVGLNCKANGLLQRELNLDEFFIQPAATDDGTALGAALYPFYKSNNLVREKFIPYLGNEYSNQEIETTLKKYKLNYSYEQQVEEDAATEMVNGNIIGWFQEEMNSGPGRSGTGPSFRTPGNMK